MAEADDEARRMARLVSSFRRNGRPLPQVAKVAVATALLAVFGGILAPSTVSGGAVESMLPSFAVLAVASIGQHRVI